MPIAAASLLKVATRLSALAGEVLLELVAWTFSNMHERVSMFGRIIVVVVKQDTFNERRLVRFTTQHNKFTISNKDQIIISPSH